MLEALGNLGLDSPVLDFGCGTGGISAALVATGRKVIGADISPGLLACARDRQLGDDALFFLFDGRGLPLASASVDAVLTYVVLNHLMDDHELQAMLGEIHRVLRPGGRVVAIEQVRRKATIDPAVWQHRRTRAGFEQLFAAAGFQIEQVDILRYGRIPTIHAVRFGLWPERMFPALRSAERLIGRLVGVLPWDYCDVRFVLGK
ncbi:hypothetical protein P873_03070 [Arenimonas composti TR7-09 = DSM 18010]|uniref:Methyltransferase type 11 domain-containing protein n=1 Tax=Arenimonas composti TR7-09 = DSM 18010 TaxID=1121013 RepID=A0A091BHM7_9GAMM|nr:hypothetical protein P873_03070 [Arenimonas composti TR7-09 = DSM 18010]